MAAKDIMNSQSFLDLNNCPNSLLSLDANDCSHQMNSNCNCNILSPDQSIINPNYYGSCSIFSPEPPYNSPMTIISNSIDAFDQYNLNTQYFNENQLDERNQTEFEPNQYTNNNQYGLDIFNNSNDNIEINDNNNYIQQN
eukprot:220966_1